MIFSRVIKKEGNDLWEGGRLRGFFFSNVVIEITAGHSAVCV